MGLTIGGISMYMGPVQLGAPDNLEEVIIQFIDGAQKKLDIAVQEIDNWNIANAIVRAKKERKVTVNVVLEGDYLKSYPGLKNPFIESGSLMHNREIMAVMLRAGINLKIDFNTKIFHQKFIIRDRKDLLTGSTNFTDTGVTKNLNHVIIFNDKKVADIYSEEYREIMKGHFGTENHGRNKIPDDEKIDGVPIRILFAPDHNPEMEIMKQMLKARERVDYAIFTFSQSSGIDDTIIALEKAQIPVRGILDNKQGNQGWAATRVVKHGGAETYLAEKPEDEDFQHYKLGKLHHKLMVIDKQVVIGGSFNYTGAANTLNDENIFIIGDLDDETSRFAQQEFGQFAFNEIDRIINVFGKEVEEED